MFHMGGRAKKMKTEGEDSTIPKVLRDGDHSTDIIFSVEERNLHFTKAVLTMCSPVFHTLLTPEYIQKHLEGIPLPGKTYRNVAFFLQLIHPVYSVTPLTDDRLLATLALAKEYQVDHITTKCEQYIGIQLQLHEHNKMLTVDALLIYLTACDQHQLAKHRGALVKLVSEETTHDLQASRFFGIVPPTSLKDGLFARSQILEESIHKLEGSNQKLEESIQILEGSNQKLEGSIQILEGSNKKLKGRNSQLESGFNKIKSKINDTRTNITATGYARGQLDGIITLLDAMETKCFT